MKKQLILSFFFFLYILFILTRSIIKILYNIIYIQIGDFIMSIYLIKKCSNYHTDNIDEE